MSVGTIFGAPIAYAVTVDGRAYRVEPGANQFDLDGFKVQPLSVDEAVALIRTLATTQRLTGAPNDHT